MKTPAAYTKCCIPFCGRTSGASRICYEYICHNHWRFVPRRQRHFLFRLRRKLKRGYNARTIMQEQRAWQRCKRLAIKHWAEWHGYPTFFSTDHAGRGDKTVLVNGFRDHNGTLHITSMRER